MSDLDLSDALRELGVENDVKPEQAHRAYIRLLKKCRPEDDPRGFARLRAAYDTVRAALAEGTGAAGGRLTRGSEAGGRAADARTQAMEQASAIESPDEWTVVDRAFRLAAATPAGPPPPVLVALETICVLLALGRVDDAVALERSVSEYVKIVGETRALPGALAIRRAVVRDLLALTGVLPAEMARAVADVFLRGYPVFTLRRLVRAEPGVAPRAREVLAKSSSPVAQVLGPVFASREGLDGGRPRPAPAARSKASTTRVGIAVITLLFGCLAAWTVRAPAAVAQAPVPVAAPAPTALDVVPRPVVAAKPSAADAVSLDDAKTAVAAIGSATTVKQLRDAVDAAAARCQKLERGVDADYTCRYQRPLAEVRTTVALLARHPPATTRNHLCRAAQDAAALLREGSHDNEKDVASDLTSLGQACL